MSPTTGDHHRAERANRWLLRTRLSTSSSVDTPGVLLPVWEESVYRGLQTPSDPEHGAFPDALNAVVAKENCVDLVSPYLSFAVLAALTKGRGFRLVTDLHACFEGGVEPRLVEFLSRNADVVRDLRGVHAKVVVGSSSALLGSANLTTYALKRRFEMSCLVEGNALTELQEWFTSLWEHASPVDSSQIEAVASKAAREAPSTRSGPSAGATLPTRTGGLGWLADASSYPRKSSIADVPATDVSDAEFDQLVKVLRLRTGSRAAARIVMSFFDEALDQIALGVDDDRLHMNFGRGRMSITLGQRYVIWLVRKHSRNTLGLLLDDFDVARKYASTMADVTSGAFRKGGEEDVPSFYWPPEKLDVLPDDVKQSWRRGIRDELARCGPSSYVAKKRPALYSVIRSIPLRWEVVRRAFPCAWWFGVNNGRAGHMTLDDVKPLLEGEQLHWPVGHSKRIPWTAYEEMLPGDEVLIWTGRGLNPDWGLLGVARVVSVAGDHVVLHRFKRFEEPVRPYREQAVESEAVRLLFDVFGDDFKPLGDVRQAVYGKGRTNPITVARVAVSAVDDITTFANRGT